MVEHVYTPRKYRDAFVQKDIMGITVNVSKRENLKTGVTRKQSMPNFPKTEHLLPPYTHTYVSRGNKCLFFGKFGTLCFLVTPVLRFVLLPYYRRITFLAHTVSYKP